MLREWLEAQGADVVLTRWNDSSLTRDTVKKGKKRRLMGALSFSLLHATDFAHRYETIIRPALQAGKIVLADRYVYTAYARDAARGIDPGALRKLYGFAVQPDLTLYFRVSIDVALERLLRKRPKKGLSFYEAGMDMGLTDDPVESYRLFQYDVTREYERMVDEFDLQVVEAQRAIAMQHDEIVKRVMLVLRRADAQPGASPGWLGGMLHAS
jgi:dTMP kinase